MAFSVANIITVFILGILVISIVTSGRILSAASSVLSVLIFNYLFTEPRFTLSAHDPGYPVTFLIMLTASFITGTLAGLVKEQARQSDRKAYRTEILLETSRKLQQAKDGAEILGETARQLVRLLDRTVVTYPARDSKLGEACAYPGEGLAATGDRAAAERALAGSEALPSPGWLYLPVRGAQEALAVVGIAVQTDQPLDEFEKSLAIAMLGECALALEKERLNERQKEISLTIEREQFRANLLRTISHDLRTPLTSISGNAGILMANAEAFTEEWKKSLYADIYDDSMWLIDLVENLLSVTRIDNGPVKLSLQSELMEEVIQEAIRHANRKKAEHTIEVRLEDELLMAKMDARLIAQVLINLLNNAIQYTPPGSTIVVSAFRAGDKAVIEVLDDGPGIPDEQKPQLFDLFYTTHGARGDRRRGLGLGLSLCRSIVRAHGGEISVRDNVPHGAVFCFTLILMESFNSSKVARDFFDLRGAGASRSSATMSGE